MPIENIIVLLIVGGGMVVFMLVAAWLSHEQSAPRHEDQNAAE